MATYDELAGRLVVITGGANGIGQAMVEAFHAQGAVVCFCDLDDRAGMRLAKRLGNRAEFSKVNLCREAGIKRWVADLASIVNFSSITFYTAPANMSAYVATKAAAIGLTRSLSRELGPRRIRVNTISPGWIMTDRQLSDHVTPAVKRQIRREQCIPDLNQPDEVADVALFLASDASRAVTGQEILVDRGWVHG